MQNQLANVINYEVQTTAQMFKILKNTHDFKRC